MKKSHILGTASFGVLSLINTTAMAVILPLEGRLPLTPGGNDYQAYYDRNLDITWAANATINGRTNWYNQITWVETLTIGGVGGWRLPSADVNGDNVVFDCRDAATTQSECADNEMGFLYWVEGITYDSPGPFSNIPDGGFHFSETENADTPTCVWVLTFRGGSQESCIQSGKEEFMQAWAVHIGDVGDAVIPIPAAVWLFGTGLLGLIGISRRKKAA